MRIFFSIVLLSLGSLAACGGEQQMAAKAPLPIKLFTHQDTTESMLNMLYVTSPWSAGEYMALDFPEHSWGNNFSGVSTDTRDGQPHPSRWNFNADSSEAWYEVTAADGNLFRASAEVDSMAVRLEMSFTNNTTQPITDIRILVCTRAHQMRAFADTSFANTWVAVDGQPVQLGVGTTMIGEVPEEHTRHIMNVRGGPDNRELDDMGWFSASWSKPYCRLTEEISWPPVIATHAYGDTTRWLGTIWDPSRAIFSNPRIPCIHSDPVPDNCPPGETTTAKGVVFFHNGSMQELVERAENWQAEIHSSPGPVAAVPKLSSYTDMRTGGVRDLFIHSPWDPTKYLSLSFPEHCWGNGLPNTSHDNREPMASPWQFSADGTTAWYENVPKPGVIYRARVDSDSMAARLTCTIVNNADEPVTSIRTLVCLKPDSRRDPAQLANAMTGFGDTCFARTWIWVDREPMRLGQDTHYDGDIPERGWKPEEIGSKINWGVNVKGGLDNRTIDDIGWFRGGAPGRIVGEVADPPLIAIGNDEYKDRWLATIWSPSRVLFCNPQNPCFHSDPMVPDCPAQDSISVQGIVLFHQGTLDGLLERAEGWLAQ